MKIIVNLPTEPEMSDWIKARKSDIFELAMNPYSVAKGILVKKDRYTPPSWGATRDGVWVPIGTYSELPDPIIREELFKL